MPFFYFCLWGVLENVFIQKKKKKKNPHILHYYSFITPVWLNALCSMKPPLPKYTKCAVISSLVQCVVIGSV